MSKLAFVDLETTGVDQSRHEVWEIGLVIVDGEQDTRYCWQICPDLTTADPMALKVGRYYQRIRDAGAVPGTVWRVEHPELSCLEVRRIITAAAAAGEIAALLDGVSFAAANVAFDSAFLAAFLRANGQCPTWDYHLVEIESYAAGALGWAPPWKLDKLMTELGASIPEDQRHTALGDAVGIFELWKAAREGRKEVPW